MSRFILVIQSTNTLLRAALVTRELRTVASAHQQYQVREMPTGSREFDPLEVWYKAKQVIAACLDIGRTLPREILAIALVGQEQEAVIWFEQGQEIIARGMQLDGKSFFDAATGLLLETRDAPIYFGTMNTWLLWNLTGEYVTTKKEIGDWRLEIGQLVMPKLCASTDVGCFGKTHVRAPLNAELSVAVVVNEAEMLESVEDMKKEGDRVLIGEDQVAIGTTKIVLSTKFD